MDYYAIGQRIRKIRRSQRLSQEQVAERIGISTTHMSHIETGNTKLSLPVLVDVAAMLGVSTDTLLFDAPASQRAEANESIKAVLESCTSKQAAIIAEIVKSAKTAMDMYE